LCIPGAQTELAFIRVADFPLDDTAVFERPLDPGQGVRDATGTIIETDDYVTAIGSTGADLKVHIDRVPTDPDTDAVDEYLVKLASKFEVYRLTFGIVVTGSLDPNDYQFGGCGIQAGAPSSAQFNCNSNPLLGPSVHAAESLAFGPTDDADFNHPNVLYVSVRGGLPSGEDEPVEEWTLVQIPETATTGVVILGTLTVPAGTSLPPGPTSEGVDAFVLAAGLGPPVTPTVGVPPSLGDAFMSATDGSTLDSDLDTITNDAENCPHTPNPGQEDQGRLLLSEFDGVGDACQCGDLQINDGAVFPNDVGAGLQFLADPAGDPSVAEFCSVSDGTECNIKDLVVLQRRTIPPPVGSLEQVCERANE
jgi:hypothetical protein